MADDKEPKPEDPRAEVASLVSPETVNPAVATESTQPVNGEITPKIENSSAVVGVTQTSLAAQTSRSADGAGSSPPANRRGLLDIKVTLSNPSPTAGTEFTLYVLVTNPFDVPIWPESPQVFLPSEIRTISTTDSLSSSIQSLNLLVSKAAKGEVPPREDLQPKLLRGKRRWWGNGGHVQTSPSEVAANMMYLAAQSCDLDKELTTIEAKREKIKADIDNATAGKTLAEKLDISKSNPQVKALVDELDSKTKEADAKRERMGILRDEIIVLSGASAVVAESDLTLRNFSVAKSFYVKAKGQVLLDSPVKTPVVTLDSSLRPGDALQPGNTAVYTLLLTTKSRLFFRPIQYSLQHSLNFSFDPKRTEIHTNTASQLMTIRAPITSVMVGSIVGGLAGFLAKSLQDWQQNHAPGRLGLITGALLTPILSAMAVVFLARKSETQSMVSIEDFWGGLVIGFLVGYGGSTAFESLTHSGAGGAGAQK